MTLLNICLAFRNSWWEPWSVPGCQHNLCRRNPGTAGGVGRDDCPENLFDPLPPRSHHGPSNSVADQSVTEPRNGTNRPVDDGIKKLTNQRQDENLHEVTNDRQDQKVVPGLTRNEPRGLDCWN